MKHIWALAAGAMLSIAQPALADVKAGVDAWQQGDYDRAIALWQPLAQAGDPDAQFNMGQAYKLGRGVKADMASAIDWYRKAAAQGHERAEDNLGLLMFQQGDRAAAFPYLQRSAARGEARAQYIVGTALFNGDLTAKDWPRAYAMMSRASASGLAPATASLKQMDKYVSAEQRQQGLALARAADRKDAAVADAAPIPKSRPVERENASAVTTAPLPSPTPTERLGVAKAPALPPPAKPKAPAEKVASAKPAAAKPAPPAPAAGGAWRIQLGAFSEEQRARALWSRLTGKVKGLSAYQLYLVKGGAVTRLQAGPLASSVEAERLCGAIKATGAECMPRKM